MKEFKFENIKENSKVVNINEICFNSWNPKIKRSKEYDKVLESVRINGLTMPIIVREIDNDNFKYEVLDGEQRLTAALDLGFQKMWIVDVGKVSDEEAKSKTIWMEMSVPFDKEQLGSLLLELKDKIELPYNDKEIELISGVELTDEETDEFEDDFNNVLVSFGINVLPDNKPILKSFFKKMKEDNNWSENTTIMTIVKFFEDYQSQYQNKINTTVQEEQQKEINFSGE